MINDIKMRLFWVLILKIPFSLIINRPINIKEKISSVEFKLLSIVSFIEKLKIFLITYRALFRLSALKKIHARVTKIKVINTWTEEVSLFLQFILYFFLNASIPFSIMLNIPCIDPHTTKVQFAPCHKPLTKKTKNRLKYTLIFFTLFPPREKYK